MEDLEFREAATFYQFVSENLSLKDSEGVSRFCQAFEQINVGCGCQKKARIARCDRFFMALSPELTVDEKAQIKELAGGASVNFYNKDGGLFLHI